MSQDIKHSETTTLTTSASMTAWLMYVVIVFEILFMVSPAALYYYSAYGLPLNALASNPYTSWLTQYILPHFTYHGSTLGALLIALSWPLIVLGMLMFLWGFCQIYYAKLTGGAAVTGGLYRFIRHPQYTGLAIAGLGTTFFWSRFLVLIAYVTMLFLYVLLARNEERRCLAKYGDSYQQYLEATGRFFPRRWTNWLPDFHLRGGQVFLVYLVVVAGSVLGGWMLKREVLGQMLVLEREGVTAVIVAPMAPQQAEQVLTLALTSIDRNRPRLAYVVPGSWNIPELGIKPDYAISAADELSHPMLHGNVPNYGGSTFHVLVAEPGFRGEASRGLMDIISMRPLFRLDVDVAAVTVVKVPELDAGRWAGLPVPVY